jgi:predicted nuclease with RNAse H fold
MLTKRGMRVAKSIRRLGISAVETFPGAVQDLLGMPRKQFGLAELQQSLMRVGCKGDVVRRSLTGDELDAVSCALVAMDYARGSYLAIGDPSEIMMILPRLNAGKHGVQI